jgi:hypothetical protein
MNVGAMPHELPHEHEPNTRVSCLKRKKSIQINHVVQIHSICNSCASAGARGNYYIGNKKKKTEAKMIVMLLNLDVRM